MWNRRRWLWMHSIFGLYPIYRLSMELPAKDSLLPLIFAVDHFKQMQEGLAKEASRQLLPPFEHEKNAKSENAIRDFNVAMVERDESHAERSIVGMSQGLGSHLIVDTIWRQGARDFRQIGHKAIFTTSVCRMLNVIGWRSAQPALRALTRGLLDFGPRGEWEGFDPKEQEYQANLIRARETSPKLRADWPNSKDGEHLIIPLLERFRQGDASDACDFARHELATHSVGANAVFTAVHLGAGELMMRKPGLHALHATTTASALHHAHRVCGDPELRLLLLLQSVAWVCHFNKYMQVTLKMKFKNVNIDELSPAKIPRDPSAAVKEILSAPGNSSQKALTFGKQFPDSPLLLSEARQLLIRKSHAVHDYKFLAAICEDLEWVIPAWRPAMLAASTHWLKATNSEDSRVMQKARAAIGTV